MAAISSDENPGIIEAALRWFWTVWEVLRVIRFSAALTIIFSIVIIMVDQAYEVLVALADRENFVWRLLLLMATGILFSLNAWYWARIALYASPPQPCDPAEWGRVLERYLPRLLTLLPFIALVIAVARILVQTGRAPDAVREKLLCLAAAVTGVLVFAYTPSSTTGSSGRTSCGGGRRAGSTGCCGSTSCRSPWAWRSGCSWRPACCPWRSSS